MTAALLPVHGTTGAALANQPARVVATIKPVHALVAAVMDGAGAPLLLVEGAGSPHDYALRPSQAAALGRAEVVFRVAERFETFLAKPLVALAPRARVVSLIEVEGLSLHSARLSGPWSDPSPEAEAPSEHGHEGPLEPHIWLDPLNGKVMAMAIAGVLGEVNPPNARLYRRNAEALASRLDALHEELAARVAGLKGRPFLVFHDAYGSFEARYGLRGAGALTVEPHRAPGARRVAALRAHIREEGAVCVFSEPQYPPGLVETLIEGTGARRGLLDPLGAALAPGPELYFDLMRGVAESFAACLGAGS